MLLNYLATTFFNLATLFSLKVAKWRLWIFFNFEPCNDVQKPVYRSTQIIDTIFSLHNIVIYPIQDLLNIQVDESV